MAEFFDEARWCQAIKQPTWYLELYPELRALQKRRESLDNKESSRIKREVSGFFEKAYKRGELALGRSGPNLDIQRQPVDTIVVHHTSAKSGFRLARMNVEQMLSVYVPYFNNPTTPGEEALKGQPLWSNHIRADRPVFYLYHWLVRMDGRAERLLEDDELGWHAANWDVNRRSVAICLDNDYEKRSPAPRTLQNLAQFIVAQYPQVSSERIFGHCEVSQKHTICPGTNYVSGWKNELLKLVERAKE